MADASHAEQIETLLSLVDTPSEPGHKPHQNRVDATADDGMDELPPAWQDAIRDAGRQAFHTALVKGTPLEEAKRLAGDAAAKKLDALLTHGQVESIRAESGPAEPKPTPKSTGERGTEICEAGRQRSQKDVDMLRAAGFAMAEPLYDRGTMVIELGVANARLARVEYDALPLVSDACKSLGARIKAEHRRNVDVQARDISMLVSGQIHLGAAGVHEITEHGFAGMVERLGYGGAAYLSKCPPALRATNVNAQRDLLATAEDKAIAEALDKRWTDARAAKPEPRKLAARVRDRRPNSEGKVMPEIFAVVSTGYPAFDADLIAEAFAQAMPADARGTVRYDPSSTGARFEALFHSTVAPEHFVAGEVFRTGIRVRSSDSGDGSIVVRAIAFQNLCLNLIIIDKSCREIARIRHVGSVDKLRKEFTKAMVKAKSALGPFLKQWGYACEEDIVGALRADGVKLPANHEEILRGVFASVLASRRVRFPRVAGRGRAGQIDDLVAAWKLDESGATSRHHGLTRAAVVNAITRAAQGWLDALDPWATDALELDAAKLLWGTAGERPAPLGFLDKIAEETEEVLVASGQSASA